jgi:hypothetical protein
MEHGRLAKPLPRRSVGEAVKRKPPLFMSGHAWTMNGKNMSYLLSNDVTSGSSVDKEFDPPLEDRVKARKNADMPLAIEDEEEWNAPRVLRVSERRKGGVPAILGWSVGPFLVCEAIKYRLELLAPGDCGFKPFELWGLSDPSRDHCYGTYYWVFPPRLDAIVIEETEFAKGRGRAGYEDSAGRISSISNDRCVIDKRMVANHPLWRLPSDFGVNPDSSIKVGWNAYFCSDELRDFLKSERLDGWSFDKKCVDRAG